MNMYIVDTRKLKNLKIYSGKENNYNGFLLEPSHQMKKNIFKKKEFYPILIINPIFPAYDNKDSIISVGSDSNCLLNSINNQVVDSSKDKIETLSYPLDNNDNKSSLNEKFCLGYIE